MQNQSSIPIMVSSPIIKTKGSNDELGKEIILGKSASDLDIIRLS